MSISCRKVDLNLVSDADIVMKVWTEYSEDPSAAGEAPSEYTKTNLINEMRKRSIHVFIGYVDESPAGIAICIEGFSTFSCKSLLNIHDLGVLQKFRRRGVGQCMLSTISSYAKTNDYCKLTLEVLEKNKPAWDGYIKAGFKPYQLNPELGWAVEMQKYV